MVRLNFLYPNPNTTILTLGIGYLQNIGKNLYKKFSVVGGAFTMCKILYIAFQEIGMLGKCQVFVGKKQNF